MYVRTLCLAFYLSSAHSSAADVRHRPAAASCGQTAHSRNPLLSVVRRSGSGRALPRVHGAPREVEFAGSKYVNAFSVGPIL